MKKNKEPIDSQGHVYSGSVYNLILNNEGNFADSIVKRDSADHSPLVMGQFIILAVDNDFNRVFIGTVESEVPDMENPFELKNSLKNSQQFGKKIDRMYADKNLFTAYRCRMLGVCLDSGGIIKYYSNIRTYPAPTSLSLYVPSNEFMNRLFATAVNQSDNDAADVIFEIGKLQYGTDPQYTQSYTGQNAVSVQFNATNLLRKRTGIFGKSGYGKSNTVKTVIGMMSTKHPNCGQLIIDTNGEYALDNAQNEGLMDIFFDADMKDKCVLYTHRNVADKMKQKFGPNSIKQLKFDVYDKIKPAIEIVLQNLDGRTEPLYLNPWSAALDGVDDESKYFLSDNIPNPSLVWAIWYAALNRAGISPYNKKHTKFPLTIGKEYLTQLTKDYLTVDGKLDPDIDIGNPEVRAAIIKHHNFIEDGHSVKTNEISAMVAYAEWFFDQEKEAEKAKKKPSSVKGFLEIMENNRRLVALKAYNVERVDGSNGGVSLSLGEAVFKDLLKNKIVILDLASVSIQVAKTLAQHVLSHLLLASTKMFGDHAMRDIFEKFDALVYIEEAQNYLKPEEVKNGSIYERIAKEGRKFHIGLVYVTQQPSAIDSSITSQTENIIAMHMSNSSDCFILNSIKDKFDKLTCKFIKDEAQKGLAYIYAEPHQPFVLPCQIHHFNKKLILDNRKKK